MTPELHAQLDDPRHGRLRTGLLACLLEGSCGPHPDLAAAMGLAPAELDGHFRWLRSQGLARVRPDAGLEATELGRLTFYRQLERRFRAL